MSTYRDTTPHPKTRCSMCDEWHKPGDPRHAHNLPQSGPLRWRWIKSGLPWSKFHDLDPEARAWGHRDAIS